MGPARPGEPANLRRAARSHEVTLSPRPRAARSRPAHLALLPGRHAAPALDSHTRPACPRPAAGRAGSPPCGS